MGRRKDACVFKYCQGPQFLLELQPVTLPCLAHLMSLLDVGRSEVWHKKYFQQGRPRLWQVFGFTHLCAPCSLCHQPTGVHKQNEFGSVVSLPAHLECKECTPSFPHNTMLSLNLPTVIPSESGHPLRSTLLCPPCCVHSDMK